MNDRRLIIEFKPTFENVDIARSAISGICQYAFPAPEAAAFSIDFSLAVTEAMNNAVEHSRTEKVVIELIINASAVVFKMTTNGLQFDPTAQASFPDLSNTDDAPEGGFGLAIIREMVDRALYEYKDGKNVLTLEKMFCYPRKEDVHGV